MQLQRRLEAGRRREELVLISKDRMAESRAERVVDAPCIEAPPVRETFVIFCLAGAGDPVREGFWDEEGVDDLEVLKSEIRLPAAEGGGFATGA
jgi:hypothetical protein